MEKMRLIVADFETIKGNRPAWSTIYLECGRYCFPDNQWTDATSAVLEMWIGEIYRLIRKTTDSAILYFMDGDYSICLNLLDNETAIAKWIAPNNTLVLSRTINLCHFARQLLSAVGKLTAHHSTHSQSPELQALIKNAELLRASLAAHG